MALTAEEEQYVRDIKALLVLFNSGLRCLGPFRVSNPVNGETACFIEQNTGVSGTALAVFQPSNNPCVRAIATGNSAAIEATQIDGEDALDATGADLRARQTISSLAVNIASTGELRFSDTASIAAAGPGGSPDYYGAMTLNAQDTIVIGNTDRGWPIKIQVDDENPIEFVVNGSVIMRINSEGVRILSPATDPETGEEL